jgi:acyl-coenzyme A synthetase/AMP-(fatty) acid ligase
VEGGRRRRPGRRSRRRGTAPGGAAAPAAGDTAPISYTSGTSGKPKGALNTHGNISFNAHRQVRLQGFPDDAVLFALTPLFHITGMVCQSAAALAGGHTAFKYPREVEVLGDLPKTATGKILRRELRVRAG